MFLFWSVTAKARWNRANMFTGWKDVGLSEEGVSEAHRAGQRLKEEELIFNSANCLHAEAGAQHARHHSRGSRARKAPDHPGSRPERTRLWRPRRHQQEEARKRFGADRCISGSVPTTWRRPAAASLKDTAARVCPFFDRWIVPELKAGKNVIVVAHGNSLRSLIMEIDKLTPDEVQHYSWRPRHRSSTASRRTAA